MYDIIVAGGGFAGAAAALAAARMGKKVLIFDRGNAFGGAASECLVMPFMPFFTKVGDKKDYLSRGIFAEICAELKKMDALKDDRWFSEEALKLIWNRLLLQAGAEILFHASLARVKAKDGEVQSVTVLQKEGLTEYEAKMFIDATGDADLCYLASFPFRLGREEDSLCQPMTLCFRTAGVDEEKWKEEKPALQALYKEALQRGEFRNPRENILSFLTLTRGMVHFNTTRVVKKNPTSSRDITLAEIEAREQVFEVFAFLKKNASSFRNATLISTAARIGVRESRMIDGEYVLTGEDLIACKKFDDGIAAANYDIDIHNPEGTGTSHHYFEPGTYYTIPYRTLIPKGSRNLLTCGRCISVTHEAQASIRIMPICCCTGEAAGTAAALALETGDVRKVSAEKLRGVLREHGQRVD